MANGTKVYNIKINGLTESVTAADALIQKLDQLQARLDALSQAGVTKISGINSKSNSELSDQEKLLNKIAEAESKIAQARDVNYKYLLKLKEELKEVNTEQKAVASADRLNDGAYNSNTMAGLKQQLKDIKQLMQTTDIDSDMFTELTKQANDLNNKLKEIETSYGQFGRNVGNYSSALSGLTQITVKVGDAERTFSSVREASRQLGNELKAMAINGQQDTDAFKDLAKAVHKFQMELDRADSSMNDLKRSSAAMDKLLDAAQSLTAIGSISGGLSALFGFKDGDIQTSIQRLVALQNVLQGIETIRKQMNTQEGIGAILAKGNNAVDRFVASLTKAKVETEGLTMASRGATIAVRSLSTALKAIGVGVAIVGITALVSLFTKASKAMAEGVDQASALDTAMKKLNSDYEKRNDLLNANYIGNVISEEEYYNGILESQNKYLQDNIKLLQTRASMGGWAKQLGEAIGGKGINVDSPISGEGVRIQNMWTSQTIKNIEQAKKKWKELNEEVKKGVGLVDDLFGVTSRNQVTVGNIILGDFIKRVQEIDRTAPDATEKVEKFYNEMNSDEALNSIILNLDKYIPDEATRQAIQNIIGYVNDLNDVLSTSSTKFQQSMNQWRIDAMKDGYAKQLQEINKAQKDEEQQWVGNQEALNAIAAKYARQRSDIWESEKKARLESQDELVRLQIEKMREGYAKTIAELNLEEKSKIRKAEESERDVQEKVLAIQELYQEKRLEALRDYREKVIETQKEFINDFYEINKEAALLKFDTAEMFNENLLSENLSQTALTQAQKKIEEIFSKIGDGLNNNTMSKKTRSLFDLIGISKEDYEKIPQLYDNLFNLADDYYTKVFNIQVKHFETKKANTITELDFELQMRKREYDEEYELQKKRLLDARHYEIDSLENDEAYEERKQIILEKYNALELKAEELHNQRLLQLEENYQEQKINAVNEFNQSIQEANAKRFQDEILQYTRFYSQLSYLQAQQPQTDRSGWGIVDIASTKRNLNTVVEGYKLLGEKIKEEKDKLQIALDKNEISFDDFTQANRELDNFKANVTKATDEIVKASKNLIGDFISSINTYVQALGQGLQQVLASIADYEDSVYQKRIEELENYISEYGEKLQEQQEMTQKYADNVNDIEDELSKARGDRRQALIDMLNAQKTAQRASLAEEKRVEKEKEKLEKQKEEEEKKQKQREHQRAITDAIISAALAVVNGLATKPFVPVGIAMGALAASLGAVQVALIKAQKYKDGGLLQGKSHSEGGIKVLGGRAEVEGGEFITNKTTTTKNIELLEYINTKKKKIDLSDMVEFYGGKINKTLSNSLPKTKFANGGQIPTLRSDIDINSRLVQAMEAYAERPTVVSVVEIQDKTQKVKDVRALAGIED